MPAAEMLAPSAVREAREPDPGQDLNRDREGGRMEDQKAVQRAVKMT